MSPAKNYNLCRRYGSGGATLEPLTDLVLEPELPCDSRQVLREGGQTRCREREDEEEPAAHPLSNPTTVVGLRNGDDDGCYDVSRGKQPPLSPYS